MLTQKAKVSAKKNVTGFLFEGYFPSMNYGLTLWGACCNSNNLDFLERLHCRVARIIFNLLKDMASHGVLEHAEYSLFIFIIN